jgi:hypothetical protein
MIAEDYAKEILKKRGTKQLALEHIDRVIANAKNTETGREKLLELSLKIKLEIEKFK